MANPTFKNPLCQMFGTFLRIKRNGLGESSNDIAEKLNVGASYYRMIEAGSAHLHPNRVFLLKEKFYNAYIDPERVIKYLVGIQLVEYYLELENSPLEALGELSKIDDDFNKFFKVVKPFFNYENDSNDQKQFLEVNVVKEVSSFLSEKKYSARKTDQFESDLVDKIQETPSLTLELVMDFVKTLSQHPPMHIGDYASKWETDNRQRFVYLRGLYQDSSIIIDRENLESFHYPYLFEDNFKSLQFIFLNTDNSTKLEKEFVRILNAVLEKNKKKKLNQREINKINFISIKNYSQFEQDIQTLLSGKEKSLSYTDAFWVFSTQQGNQIGFIGAPKGNRYQVLNLTYRESLERIKIFDRIKESVISINKKSK